MWQTTAAIPGRVGRDADRNVHDSHRDCQNTDKVAGGADRDEAVWVCQERWDELRKLGQAGGWLVDYPEVPLFSLAFAMLPLTQLSWLCPSGLHSCSTIYFPPLSNT